jgi:hypothetical protein
LTESALRSEQTLRGLAVTRAEKVEAMLDKQSTVSTTQRLQERRDAGKMAELNSARPPSCARGFKCWGRSLPSSAKSQGAKRGQWTRTPPRRRPSTSP